MIVIDTHVLLWWGSGEEWRLSPAATSSLHSEREGKIYISSISAWEIAILVAKGRVGLSRDVAGWLSAIGRTAAVEFVPIDNDIAVKSVQLTGDFHKDPADRYIVATCQKLGAPLVTADEKIRQYSHIRTIW